MITAWPVIALSAATDTGRSGFGTLLALVCVVVIVVAGRVLAALAQVAASLASAAWTAFAAIGRIAAVTFGGGLVILALVLGGCQGGAAHPVAGSAGLHSSEGGR